MSYETRMEMRVQDENKNEDTDGKNEDAGPGTLSRTFEETRGSKSEDHKGHRESGKWALARPRVVTIVTY